MAKKKDPKSKKEKEVKKVSPNYKFLNPKWLFFATLISLLSVGITFSIIILFLQSRIYPALSIANTNISFLTPQKAQEILSDKLLQKTNQTLTFDIPQSGASQLPQKFDLNLKDAIDLNLLGSVNNAWDFGHHKFYFSPQNLPLSYKLNSNYQVQIAKISSQINQPAIDSQIRVEGSQITVTPSQEGKILDEQALAKIIDNYLNTGTLSQTTLPIKAVTPKLSYDTGLEIKKRLDAINLTPLKLKYNDQLYTLDLNQILSLLELEDTQSSIATLDLNDSQVNISSIKVGDTQIMDTKLKLNEAKVNEYLKKIAQDIDRPVQEPLLNIEPTQDPQKPKITQFQPPVEGQKLEIDKAYLKLSQALTTQNQQVVELPVTVVKPKNKLSNDLGINELIGRGESDFFGSIPGRVYNVNLAASRINGVLISPGETFSFDSTIGDITAETGYKQAYVIKSGRTVLDDGGGVCQVSTTLFRAVLNSGLPVVARTAHAYRVHYYEEGGYPPGIDATIFYPSVDFKFKNDTDHSILIQAFTNGLHLTVDLYGTSDGRVASLSKPVILSQTPPPDTLYQDDPSLPKGTQKQVDFAAWGANVSFSRTVTKNGVTLISETFKSNYRPWQAVYLVGTAE